MSQQDCEPRRTGMRIRRKWCRVLCAALAWLGSGAGLPAEEVLAAEQPAVDFGRDVRPVLTRYCAGCHQGDEREGQLSVETVDDLLRGGEHGAALVPGKSDQSRLWQMVSGTLEPRMPPEDQPRPTPAELAMLRAWIDAGARPATNPVHESTGAAATGSPGRAPSSLAPKPITALAWLPAHRLLAVGRHRHVDLQTTDGSFSERVAGLPGKVNAITPDHGGTSLLIATGVPGQSGEAWLWNLGESRLERKFGEHRDVLYAAEPSRDGKWIATAGYDRKIQVWNRESGQLERTLEGHHGAVYDLAFSPDGQILASASADATVKIWQVASGTRLDTLSQPLKEQLTVDISPDGELVAAAGADNRIRLWKLVSRTEPLINPLLIARYGHEQPIQRIRFTADGSRLVSTSADKTIKVWSTDQMTLLATFPQQADVVQAFATDEAAGSLLVGRMDGTLQKYDLAAIASAAASSAHAAASEAVNVEESPNRSTDSPSVEVAEQEPNDAPDDAQSIELPALVSGRIHRLDGPLAGRGSDQDSFRFHARAGETWLIEVEAARKGSPLDSLVRVLDADGRPLVRVLLQATRDSYFNFRGKDSTQTGDFRMHNWEEMRINQYLYAAGEVVKLYHYPRGPDSGFNTYPNSGDRHGYFDTTPIAHALNEPAYIVEPHPPTAQLPANGLPVFPLYFENDDESRRRWGADSLLTFTAPQEGDYIVQVADVRQAGGDDFRYQLKVRAPRPDFSVTLQAPELKVPRGSGKEFSVVVDRTDGFEGPIRLEISGLPTGWSATSPLVVEAGHLRALGTVFASSAAAEPSQDLKLQVRASAEIAGEIVQRDAGVLGPIQLAPPPAFTVEIAAADGQQTAEGVPLIELKAGSTGTVRARIHRGQFTDRVSFGAEEAFRGAPHGVFVANAGLNGVLITEAESEREVFIRVEPWVEPGEYLVHLQAGADSQPTTAPAILRIVR